ncbi:hypothetical protein [Burkholderia pyrrocinia]|uniref:hypothetical protein n=1 Tax=Burkholderia pyrrocinia TaxID=60550 RepID=UPI001BCBAD0C|nr:hypothetical protein [Burkholderia pyrrocinia]QVN19422.1 hypothetical protein JYG32_06805 [Burkholderia pyrrocinia]
MSEHKNRPSEILRAGREADRQYWELAVDEAKRGPLGDALAVIVKLHACLVDKEQLPPEWERWVGNWLQLADRMEAEYEQFAAIVNSSNVQLIRSRKGEQE